MAKTKNINDILNLLTKISENPSLNLNVESPKELISESNVNYKSQKKTIQAPVQPTIQPDSSDIKKINIINDKTSESKVKANKELDADGDIEEILMTLFDAKEIVD